MPYRLQLGKLCNAAQKKFDHSDRPSRSAIATSQPIDLSVVYAMPPSASSIQAEASRVLVERSAKIRTSRDDLSA